jgi:hypothetical protein
MIDEWKSKSWVSLSILKMPVLAMWTEFFWNQVI